MKHRTALTVFAALAAPALLLLNFIVRADGGDATLIHACVEKKSGAVRIVGPNVVCKGSESSLHWNTQHTVTTPLGSSSVDLSGTPGEEKFIVFEDDGQGGVTRLFYRFLQPGGPDPDMKQFIFEVEGKGVLGIQDGLLDLQHPGGENPDTTIMFSWEQPDPGPYALAFQDPGDFTFYGPSETGQDSLLTISDGLLDASGSDIKGMIYETDGEVPDIERDSFAFWFNRSTGEVFTILNKGGVIYKSLMQGPQPNPG